MKFEIRNLGSINKADIPIGKINIISGKNAIGKTTLAKLIYCYLAPASKDKNQITEYNIYRKLLHILVKYEVSRDKRVEECHEFLYIDKNKECLDLFRKIIKNDKEVDQEYYLDKLKDIEKLFTETGRKQYDHNHEFLINSEYCYPYGLLENSTVKIYENDELIDIKDCGLENVIYMSIEHRKDYYHNTQVRKKLYFPEGLSKDEDVIEISKKIEDIIHHCKVCGIPSGLKQLDNIRSLLYSEELLKNSIFLIDNPENDLHPKLQVKFAEILVLMALKLDIKMYINTNSPFIAEAIESYTKFYKIYDETNFYHVEKDENSDKYNLKLLDDISVSEIYREYSEAFEMIKNIQKKIKLGVDEGYF